ncbi:MAG: MnhB domain-containing protein [Lysobacterales bacterium]|jgi:multicomponent Na+:H+ antiporter subunit B
MKQIFSVLILLVLGWLLLGLVPLAQPTEPGAVASHYIEHGIEENRAANLVTSVIVNYRGLDTLGEVTVLFLSVAGAGFVLRRREGNVRRECRPSSEILQTGARILFTPIMVFGVYIFVHGHLSPGGGFQGGAVVASAVLLLLLADRGRRLPRGLLHWLESAAGFGYVLAGLAGLTIAGSFLSNQGVLPLGTWNTLFSAGVIPVIYILVGLKVGTELANLLDTMIDTGRPEGDSQ